MLTVMYERSKDIMPCGHFVNGITCENETDRDEYDSDVMIIRNQQTTQRLSDKKSSMIEHEEMQFAKPEQSFEQDIGILATQRHSDKTNEMNGQEESQCVTADQIDEQNHDLKPKQKQDKMKVNQHGYLKDITDNTLGQQNKDIQSLKGPREITNNQASRNISNNKTQTESFENKKEIKCGKKICEKKKNYTAYQFSNDKEQSGQNKDIQSLKGPMNKTKSKTSLHVSNDKKPNESAELKQEIKSGKIIREKRTNDKAYQFPKDKKQSGSVEQNKEIRFKKRADTVHDISKHKKQRGLKGQNRHIKCLKRLCKRDNNKTTYQIQKDKQKTESVEHSTVENGNTKKRSKHSAVAFDKIIWLIRTILCYIMVLVVVDSYESTQNGTWILNSTHVVFGENVVLRCTFGTNICNKGATRRWTKGKFQTFLINNGNSTNERKYREVISADCSTSYLIINDFNQDDMGVEYTFAYSAMEFSSELKLERTGYISYPNNETTTGEISCEKRNLTLSLKLFDINPVPHCSMVIKNETIFAVGKTKNTSEFLSNSEYHFQYKLLKSYKQGKMYVWCNFETRNITVFDEWFNCDDPKDTVEKEDLTVKVAALLICLIFVIVLVYFLYNIWKKKKKKGKGKRKRRTKEKEKSDQSTALVKSDKANGVVADKNGDI